MAKTKKIAALLKWNRENHKTFEARAKNARMICSADEQGLDFMLAAVEA